jgi:hypothetical protein
MVCCLLSLNISSSQNESSTLAVGFVSGFLSDYAPVILLSVAFSNSEV